MRLAETKQRTTSRLREELNLKAQLLDAATDSIFLYRPDGSLIYVNEAACRSRGYSKEELMAMNGWELAIPEFAELFDPQVKEIMEKGEATFESVHLRKDGTSMLVETHSRVIKVGNEDLILSVCRDITARKQAEEFATTLIHSSQIGVYVIQDGKFRLINAQITKVLGISQDQLLGRDALSFVHPEDRALVRGKAIKMLKGERLEPYEFRVSDKVGNIKVVMETVAPSSIKESGRHWATLWISPSARRRRNSTETWPIAHRLAFTLPRTGSSSLSIPSFRNTPAIVRTSF